MTPAAAPAASGGITVTEDDGTTVAHLWGLIDEGLRQEASRTLARALARNVPVVLDTSKVDVIDTSGLAFLVQFCAIGRDEGLPVTVQDPPALVSEILGSLGMATAVAAPGAR